MCKNKSLNNTELMEQNNDSESDTSDVSMSESDSEIEENENLSEGEAVQDEAEQDEEAEQEEEDEVIKAIREGSSTKRNHPPSIQCEDFITDISFHPNEDLIAVANIVGDVQLYRYTNDGNDLVSSIEVHTKSCRDIEFSEDGKVIFSTSKDKSVMLTDVATEKLVRFYENAHEVPIYCLTVLDENLFATGDDDGTIKLWDLREKSDRQIYKAKRNEDHISDIITNEDKKYLLCSSGDGSLISFDLQNRKFHMQSEEYEEELTCLGLFRSGTKLVSGTSKGKLLLFNWGEFGLHSDAFPGPKTAINALIPITENIVATACEDGILRATHLFPHRHLGIVGQHDHSIEALDISNTGEFLASSGHDNEIRFWNIQYFEDFETLSHKHKKHERKKELANNLPSSKMKNASDFFCDL